MGGEIIVRSWRKCSDHPLLLLLTAANLGRVLELPYCRVIPNFARCGLRCTDEVSQGLGYVLYCVDQHHLCGKRGLACEWEKVNRKVRLWTELGMLGGYLSFWVFSSQAGCTKLDYLSKAGNGGH